MNSIQEHCCGADQLFDLKTAQKQYRKYIKKGPGRVTQKIIDQLSNFSIHQEDVLIDVGGGIGALQWWFLSQNGKNTVGVDASSGYQKIANKHALDLNLSDRSTQLFGDFACLELSALKGNYVTLDKVICCYPDFKSVLQKAVNTHPEVISLSYPLHGYLASIIRGFGVLFMKILGTSFKPYVHNGKHVQLLLIDLGYQLKYQDILFPWRIQTFVKM
jgi:magnesium-protoporphyrin O-methyltransferase